MGPTTRARFLVLVFSFALVFIGFFFFFLFFFGLFFMVFLIQKSKPFGSAQHHWRFWCWRWLWCHRGVRVSDALDGYIVRSKSTGLPGFPFLAATASWAVSRGRAVVVVVSDVAFRVALVHHIDGPLASGYTPSGHRCLDLERGQRVTVLVRAIP